MGTALKSLTLAAKYISAPLQLKSLLLSILEFDCLINLIFLSVAERMGGDSDEDSEGPLATSARAPGDHDQRGQSYSTLCGEGDP